MMVVVMMMMMMMMRMMMFRFCHMPKEEHERHPMNQNILINHGLLACVCLFVCWLVFVTCCNTLINHGLLACVCLFVYWLCLSHVV